MVVFGTWSLTARPSEQGLLSAVDPTDDVDAAQIDAVQQARVTAVQLMMGVLARAAGRWRRPGPGERWCPPSGPRHLAAVARPSAAGEGPERPHQDASRRDWWSCWPTAQRSRQRARSARRCDRTAGRTSLAWGRTR